MKRESGSGSNGSGCVLWLILIAQLVVILLMVGFSPEDAIKYGTGGVVAVWAILAAAPCGILCVILSIVAATLSTVMLISSLGDGLLVDRKPRKW